MPAVEAGDWPNARRTARTMKRTSSTYLKKDVWLEVSTDSIPDAVYRKNATLSRMFSSSKGFVI